MLTNLLIYRFALFNIAMLAVLGHAWNLGFIAAMLAGDASGIVIGISAVFALTWCETARRIVRTSLRINRFKRGLAGANTVNDAAKEQWLTDASDWMVGLGLIGTVIGFSIALSGINEETLNSPAGVQGAIGDLMAGMRIALNTTIAGAVFALWNSVNQRMLSTANSCYRENAK